MNLIASQPQLALQVPTSTSMVTCRLTRTGKQRTGLGALLFKAYGRLGFRVWGRLT